MFNIVAILFVGQLVHVAYETRAGDVQAFTVQNDSLGAKELSARLRPIFMAATGKPLACMGAAEGSSLVGAVFEQTVFDESVRRFRYAQPKYLIDSKAWGTSSDDPKTLLRACNSVFPSVRPWKS